MPFAIKPGQTVLFIGDSITDCGRRERAAPLGDGYVSQIAALIAARYPAHGLTIVNTGIAGNNVRDLRDRWTDDVVRRRPDWLSVKIGINDLHQWLNKVDKGVWPELFEELYEKVLTRAKKETSARLVLVDPFYLSIDRTAASWRGQVAELLPRYLRVVERMARRFNARHVRTHRAFQRLLKHYPADRFCPEPVHPNAAGHLVIAHEWLQTMGW